MGLEDRVVDLDWAGVGRGPRLQTDRGTSTLLILQQEFGCVQRYEVRTGDLASILHLLWIPRCVRVGLLIRQAGGRTRATERRRVG